MTPRDDATYTFASELFEWTGNAAWHFFAVPEDASRAEITVRVLV